MAQWWAPLGSGNHLYPPAEGPSVRLSPWRSGARELWTRIRALRGRLGEQRSWLGIRVSSASLDSTHAFRIRIRNCYCNCLCLCLVSKPLSNHTRMRHASPNHRYIGDINRVAQIEENAHFFKPHPANDAGVLHAWGLGPTQQAQHQTHQPHQRWSVTQQARPPTQLKQQQTQQQQQLKLQMQLSAQKVQASSHSLNPFQSQDKQRYMPLRGNRKPTNKYTHAHGNSLAPPQKNTQRTTHP